MSACLDNREIPLFSCLQKKIKNRKGKVTWKITDGRPDYKPTSFSEAYEYLSQGGTILGEGREGIVYDLGCGKVIKISRSKSATTPFGPTKIKRIITDFKISLIVGEIQIGPRLFDFGFLNLTTGGQVAYITIQKLSLVPKKGEIVCSVEAQEQLFNLYMVLAKLKVSTNDYNILNIMWEPVTQQFRLIDFGAAKKFKTVELAKQANISVLISITRAILGKTLQSSGGVHTVRCSEVDYLIKLLFMNSNDKNKKRLKVFFPKYKF